MPLVVVSVLYLMPMAYALERYDIIFDPDLTSTSNWSYGVYRTDASSYVKHDAEKSLYNFHVIDNVSDAKLSWGYLHQGIQLHSWGSSENKPLRAEYVFDRDKPVKWILNITLKRNAITWLNVNESSVPSWLKDQGGKGQIAIGLMFAFETENYDYMADVNHSRTLQFEIQFCRIRWDGQKEIPLFDDFFVCSTERGDEDNDVHNIFVPYGNFKEYVSPSIPLCAEAVQNYVVDLYPLLKYSWVDRWFEFFPVQRATLKWVNFYVETVNAQVDAQLFYLNTYIVDNPFFDALTSFLIWLSLSLIFLMFVVFGFVRWRKEKCVKVRKTQKIIEALEKKVWRARWDLNPRSPAPKAGALIHSWPRALFSLCEVCF